MSRATLQITSLTHKAFVRYCETFGYKVGEKADLIIKNFLLTEAGIDVDAS